MYLLTLIDYCLQQQQEDISRKLMKVSHENDFWVQIEHEHRATTPKINVVGGISL